MSHAQRLSFSDLIAASLARESRIAQMAADEVRRDLATYTLPSPRSYATSDNYALLSAIPRLDLGRSKDPFSSLEPEAEMESSSRGAGVGDSSRSDLSSLNSSDDGSRWRPDTNQPRIASTSQNVPGHRTLPRVAPDSLYPLGRNNAGERQRRASREPISPTAMEIIFSGPISSNDRPSEPSNVDELQRPNPFGPGHAEEPTHGHEARNSAVGGSDSLRFSTVDLGMRDGLRR